MNRIIIVCRANQLSTQLAAIAAQLEQSTNKPKEVSHDLAFRAQHQQLDDFRRHQVEFCNINSNGGEKSRHRTASSALEAAERPTSAADHGER